MLTQSNQGSGITRRQRSLVIITMIFLSYVAFGALLSSLMMSLTFLNGLFFTIVTTLTIGFGDIVPVTPAQRFVVCLYAVFGIIILGPECVSQPRPFWKASRLGTAAACRDTGSDAANGNWSASRYVAGARQSRSVWSNVGSMCGRLTNRYRPPPCTRVQSLIAKGQILRSEGRLS